jgi:hypothetical protein
MARRSPNFIPMNWNNNNNNNLRALLNVINNNNGVIRATPLYPTLYSVVINGGQALNLTNLFRIPNNAEITPGGLKIEILKIVGRAGRFQEGEGSY